MDEKFSELKIVREIEQNKANFEEDEFYTFDDPLTRRVKRDSISHDDDYLKNTVVINGSYCKATKNP